MVYVLSKSGQPLMPTTRHAKVRILLKKKLAKVVQSKPFTIQLLFDSKTYIQPSTLGIDSGYLNIGFAAIAGDKEIISGEVKLFQGMKERLYERAVYRRNRRQRLRYRAPRFSNRVSSKKQGWLAPSIQHKLDSHIRFIEKIKKLIPVKNVIIEVANFDIQALKDAGIEGTAYQMGEQMGFWNLREYILHRDNHKCQNPNCTNKAKEPILRVHHIVYRSEGGTDAPDNLITLCDKCHTPANHKKGKFLYTWMIEGHKVKKFKDSTFMSMVRWQLVNYLKEQLDCEGSHTYGYITKHRRITQGLEKTHYNDAFCITGGTCQQRVKPIVYQQSRRNNRSLEKFYDAQYIDTRTGEKVAASTLNCGRTTRNKALNGENLNIYRGQKLRKGERRIRKSRSQFQPKDLVLNLLDHKKYLVKGSQNKGAYIKLAKLEGQEKDLVVKVSLLKQLSFSSGFVVV